MPLATVLLDPPTALAVGSGLALVSYWLIRRHPDAEVLRVGAMGALWGGLYGLAVGWFFFRHPDWMLVYLIDAAKVPLVPAFIAFVLVCVAHGAFGALAVGTLLARGKKRFAWLVALGALGTLVAVSLLQGAQYAVVGTHAEYLAGTAPALPTVPGFTAGLIVSSIIAAGGAVLLLIVQLKRTLHARDRSR